MESKLYQSIRNASQTRLDLNTYNSYYSETAVTDKKEENEQKPNNVNKQDWLQMNGSWFYWIEL